MTSPFSKRIGKNLVAGFSAMTLALGTVTTGYAVTTPAVTNFFAQGLSGQLLDMWATGNDIGTIAILDNFQITGGASGVYSGTFVTHELVSSASAVNLASEVAAIAQQYADAASAINATYSLNLDFTATDFTAWMSSASSVPASAVAAVESWFTGYATAMSAVMGAYSMNSFLPQWVPVSAATSTFPDYMLTDSGWVNGLMQPPKTIVDNGNGTVTVTELKKGTYTMTVSEHVLDGLPIMDPYSNNAPIPGAYYPAGSRQFSGTGGVYSKDSYLIWGSSQPYDWWGVKNMQGNAFTSLPIIGTDSFCADSTVFIPITGTIATGADNYNAFWAWDCTVDGIATRSTAPDFTIRLSAKDTGYSAYPVEIFSANTTTSGSWLNNRIIGVVNGLAQMGQFKPAGTLIKDGLFFRNPIAINAEFQAVASAYYGMADFSSMVLPTSTSGTPSTTPATTLPLTIQPGWNLLGNSNNVPFDVALNFGDSSKVTTVWKWNSVSLKWAFYSPTFEDGGAAYAAGKGYEFLTTINGGEGFWVNSKISFSSILPAGNAVTTANLQDSLQGLNPLPSGWSLIAVAGYPTPVAFNNGLSSTPPATGTIAENLTTLWAWDNARGSWYFYAPSLDKAGTMDSYITSKKYLSFASGVLTPTTGFWVNRPASAGLPGYTTTTTATTSTTTVDSTTTTTLLPNTVAASGIQATMTAFQNLYASAIPSTTTDLDALFDATFLMDGMNKAETLLAFTSNTNGPSVGMLFTNITLVSPVDAGALPNDVSHQWFTFEVTGDSGPMEPWLAIKNSSDVWLIAGNQRLFGVRTDARNEKHVPSASQLLAGDQPTYSSYLDISMKQDSNNFYAFSEILVSGPGLVAANGYAGVPLYSNATGSSSVQACNGTSITTNCYDLAQITAGAQYTFTAYIQSGSVSVPAASYVSVLHALPLSQSNLIAANFPEVTNVTSSWTSGSSATVDWTLPTGLTGNWIEINGWGNLSGRIFQIGQSMNGANSATFAIPNFSEALTGISVWASAADANGNVMATSVNVDPPVAAPELGLHTATGVYSFTPATGVLNFNMTHSDFICDGLPATAGTMAVTLLDVTSMTLEGTDVWTRLTGMAGDIAGTWSFTDSVSGNSFTLNLDSAGNMSLGGNIVACPTGSTVTAPSALSNYLAEGSSYGIFPAVGDLPAGFDTLTATPTATAGSYSHQLNYVTYANNAWSAPVTPRVWAGQTAGWVVGGGAQADFTVNADGTITATDLAGNVMNFTLTETDLSGTPITNCPSGSCGTYPTGAKSYSSNADTFTKDRYKIHVETKVTDLAGNQLTAFPNLTTPDSFCASDYGIFRPIAVTNPGDNNYEVVPLPAGVLCNAASIPLYQAASAVGTVLLQEIAETASNPNVIVASNASNAAVGYLNSLLIAVFNGKAIDGQIKRAGSSYIFMNGYLNSIAANAELAANGMPLLNNLSVVLLGGTVQGNPLTLSGSVTTIAGTANVSGFADGTGTAATFYEPRDITTDGSNLYVIDKFNNSIRKIVISTGVVTTLAGNGAAGYLDGVGVAAQFNTPKSITTDGVNLYVGDSGNSIIRKVNLANGQVTTLAGSGIAGSADGNGINATFGQVNGITVVGNALYASDTNNNTIRQIDLASGDVTTIAGTAGVAGSQDGTGALAQFNKPIGITSDGVNLFVVDVLNQTIRKIVIATGVVTTLAGDPLNAPALVDGIGAAASFNIPGEITTDGTYLYVADEANKAIRRVEIATGAVTTVVSGLGDPRGLTTDGTSLFMTDMFGTHLIRQIQ
ncbi:MAG: hypothetical protein WC742_11815 [Gallionellaceae bacterium]|jgi:hypothetical protein